MGSLANSLALSVQSLQKLIKTVEMKHEPLSHCVFKDITRHMEELGTNFV